MPKLLPSPGVLCGLVTVLFFVSIRYYHSLPGTSISSSRDTSECSPSCIFPYRILGFFQVFRSFYFLGGPHCFFWPGSIEEEDLGNHSDGLLYSQLQLFHRKTKRRIKFTTSDKLEKRVNDKFYVFLKSRESYLVSQRAGVNPPAFSLAANQSFNSSRSRASLLPIVSL